jgi:AcrR family transcriptional regulator
MAEDRKNQIIKEATALFSKYGYDKVSVKQIASACGVTDAALYKHFDSKADVYDKVLESLVHRMEYRELFERLGKIDDLEKVLHEMAQFLLEFLNKNDDLYRLLLFSALRGHSKARKIYAQIRGNLIEFMAGRLQIFKERGITYDIDPLITSRCFIGMVMDCALGLNLWQSLGGKAVSPEDAISNNIPIYARGLIKKDGR